MMPIDDGYCNARPKNLNWPVCGLVKGHEGERHESADFWWLNGDGIVYPKRENAWMKSFVDDDLGIEIEMFEHSDGQTRVRIFNRLWADQTHIEISMQQFQRIIAFGDFLLHPRY